jgi:hypothetical protein
MHTPIPTKIKHKLINLGDEWATEKRKYISSFNQESKVI